VIVWVLGLGGGAKVRTLHDGRGFEVTAGTLAAPGTAVLNAESVLEVAHDPGFADDVFVERSKRARPELDEEARNCKSGEHHHST
jgi:hypothetical protein